MSKSGSLAPARTAVTKAASRVELPGYVRKEEVESAARAMANPRRRLLMRFLWVTGARISEALAVRVQDVDFMARLVRLPTLKRKRPMDRTLTLKADFLGEAAVLINAEKLVGSDRLFPWSRSYAFELVRDALLEAGVERPRAHPHALRHGHAVHAIQNGVPLNVLQRALGHAAITSTSVYLAVTGEDVRRFYEGIDW